MSTIKKIKKVTCTGFGSKYCKSEGAHSFFNHAMDSHYAHPGVSNIPEGYDQDGRLK